MLDTGAKTSVISLNLVKKMKRERYINTSEVRNLIAASGSALKVRGTIKFPVFVSNSRSYISKDKDGKEENERSVGTGVVIVDKGIILTNLHVVQGAETIHITFADGLTTTASITGVQPENDLAVLQAHKIPDDMIAAVRKVASGGLYVSSAAAEALASAVAPASSRQGLDALSHREYQVYRLLTAGKSVSEIGAQLELAGNTVSTYRARILEKTGTRNDVELALYAQQHTKPENQG